MKDVTYESLDTYLTIARKIVTRFAKHLLKNDEAIGEVASAVAQADMDWNPDYRSAEGKVRSLYSYRNQRGIWAIQKYLKDHKAKHTTISLSYKDRNSESSTALSGVIEDKKAINPSAELIQKENSAQQVTLLDEMLNSSVISEIQSKYLRAYYLEEKTLEEVGTQYGVSKEAVRQGIKLGLSSIKKLL